MEKLKKYQQKRDFEKTKEPSGKTKSAKKGKLIFCVQHHLARRDHFDFRLQHNGVLLSWAVPKGPSYNPADKRLAVHVEDHPVDYASFEGTIPKGQYGGGTVMLWDEGEYLPLNDFEKGLKDGSLKFELFGTRLVGKWTLVKLKSGDEQENWLLIKENDQFVQKTSGIAKFKTSVASGRTMQQIAQGEDLSFKKNPFKTLDVKLCKLVDKVPKQDYIYEIKFDGYRIVAFCEGGNVTLKTRNGNDFSLKFTEILQALKQFCNKRACVLDGEIVALDDDGKPNFQALQNHLKNKQSATLAYMIFDILSLDGEDLKGVPLLARKQLLKGFLAGAPQILCYVDHVEKDGQKFFDAVKAMGLEGVVCKKLDSRYNGLRNDDWLKCKCYATDEFVIGGYQSSDKKALSALLLGYYQNGKLVFVGHAGTGFDAKQSQELLNKFKKITIKKSAFINPPKSKNQIFWLKPMLVAQVQYAEITKENLLRQASFKGLREDKNAGEVVFDKTENNAKSTAKVQKNAKKTAKNVENSDVLANEIKISNPNKVVFKKQKITKMEIVQYYQKVAKRLLLHCSNRLLTVVRCHENINDTFFKKHPTSEKFAYTVDLSEENLNDEYFYINNIQGLIEQVQLGTIEFHIWGSKVLSNQQPDYMVFDLDPDKGLGLDKVRQGVKDLKSILNQLKLKAYLKTSGGKGYHVVVPFAAGADWQTFHDFAENVAQLMQSKWPERYTTNIRKANRKGKIFIDFMRNTRGATSVAPYSLRAREGAKVSTPILWKELDTIAPDGIDMKEAVLRLKKPDPWKDIYKTQQKIKNNKD